MKKLIITLITIMMFIPTIVLADMSAPLSSGYQAEITNPNGVTINENGKQIHYEYKDKITILYDYENQAVTDKYGYINLNDITPIKEEYELSNNELGTANKALTLYDLEIKKGPASAYKSTGTTIPANTEISIKYLNRKDGYGGANSWVYVEYNGTKGYIETVEISESKEIKKIVIHIPEIDIITTSSETYETDNGKITIPANTKINGIKYSAYIFRYLYTDYQGKNLFIDDNAAIYEKNASIKALEDINLYKEGYDSEEIVGLLKKGTTINEGLYISNYLVYIDSLKGWVNYEDKEKLDIHYGNDDEENKSTTTTTKKVEPTTNPKDYTLYYVIGSFAICITAVVILILVNKNKKKEVL